MVLANSSAFGAAVCAYGSVVCVFFFNVFGTVRYGTVRFGSVRCDVIRYVVCVLHDVRVT